MSGILPKISLQNFAEKDFATQKFEFRSCLMLRLKFCSSAALRKMIAAARAEEVPKATIESAIKRASTVAEMQELIYEMLGPG